MTTEQPYLYKLIETELVPLVSQISPLLAESVTKYVASFADEAALAVIVGDITGRFWSMFDPLTRTCILQSPSVDLQYLLIYVATTRTDTQEQLFKAAFDLIFSDMHARLQGLEGKEVLAHYIQSVLDLSGKDTLSFWQARADEYLPSFWELLKRVVYAENGPYAETQRDALDVLLMMRPFLMMEISGRQNTNELVQQSLGLLERATNIHRFDLLRALNKLYPEIANVNIDMNVIFEDLGWSKEDIIANFVQLMRNEKMRNEVIEKIEKRSNENGTSAIGIFLRCKERLKTELNIELGTGLFIQAFSSGRLQLADMMGLLTKLMTALNNGEASDLENNGDGINEENNPFAGLEVSDIISQITHALVVEGLPVSALENPPVD